MSEAAMLEEFLSTWRLFQDTYLAGWLIALLASLVGVMVVARDQIFIGATVAESSTLGVAVALWLGAGDLAEASWVGSDTFLSALAVAASVLAALATARWGAGGRETTEALTGWIFLLAGSLSILVVSRSPHGMEEVHRLLLSSIIGASRSDVWVFAALVAATGALMLSCRRRILFLLVDEDGARALGIRTREWSTGLCCLLGLVVGLALSVSGLLYTFGCLVLPALAARSLCRRAFAVFLAAPAIALSTSVAAFVLANHFDQPPGQMAVALLCGVVAAAWLWRRFRPRR